MPEVVRVLRIIEYVGPRKWVEHTLERSVHGTRKCGRRQGVSCEIRAATLGDYPEVLDSNILDIHTIGPHEGPEHA